MYALQSFTPASHPSATPPTQECFPFLGGRYLSVAASLNGGNALAAFVRTLQQWALDLGCQVPQCEYPQLRALGCEDP